MRRTELFKKLPHPKAQKYKVYTLFAVVNSLRTYIHGMEVAVLNKLIILYFTINPSLHRPTPKQFFCTLICAIVKQGVLRIMKHNCSVDFD